jgi:hypothetical protein
MKIKTKNFPFGKPSKTLENAVKWINKNKKALKKVEFLLDYPDYAGMPDKITKKLYVDDVHWINQQLFKIKCQKPKKKKATK